MEVTAVARVLMYVLTLIGVIAWGRKRGMDWLGVAVLVAGIGIAILSGIAGRGIEGVLRMPVTMLVCVYILTRQQGAPSLRRRDLS